MTLKINKAFALLTLLTSVAFVGQAHAADGDTRDVVVDKNSHKVMNTFGNCVRTKWDKGVDECGSGEAQPAPKAPAPMAKREPKNKSRSYLVFFDFDKSNLSPDAQEIIKTFTADAKKKHATSFEVIGHTDRSGTDSYNMALSKRRADSVKKQLLSIGAKGDIEEEAKGESEPLVPTADGVKEPQNRRAELIFGYSE